MAGLGILVILLDLATDRKGWLAAAALLGLAAPLALTLVQLAQLTGIYGPALDNLTPASSILAPSLSVDRFGLFFNFLVITAAALVILASVDYVKGLTRLQGEFYGLLLLSASGMMLLASATELITIYVALELTTLPPGGAGRLSDERPLRRGGGEVPDYQRHQFRADPLRHGPDFRVHRQHQPGRNRRRLGAGDGPAQPALRQLRPAGGRGAADRRHRFQAVRRAFPYVGAGRLRRGAPPPVVAFLSVASKAVAFGLLLRIVYTAFPEMGPEWGILLAALAAVSMTVGNLVAITQSNIRRLFGYSTIAHAGYILVGVAAMSQSGGGSGAAGGGGFATFGPSSVLFYLAAYTAANLTAFFAIIAIGQRIDSDRIDDYAGMVRRSPFLAVALALALIALIGVPPTGIFVAKIYIFTAAIKSGLVWLAVLGVINSVISAYYYVKIIRVMFLQPIPEGGEETATGESGDEQPAAADQPSKLTNLAVALAALATVLLGLAPGPLLQAAESAVTALSGVALR